jgi:drug/metabolite transporter (DMT)-like permease
MPIDAPPRSRVAALAPALFVLLWSTGFIVARFATRDAGPLTFLAVRMVIAAGMLALVAVGTRSPRPSTVQTRWLVVSGLGMHAIYLGGVFIAIDLGMPSGVGALIAGLHPVVTALAARRVLHEQLVRLQWIGVGFGFLGVVAVVVDRLLAHSTGLTGWALLGSGLSVLGMSGGTLVQRRYAAQAPLLWGTVVQYTASAVVLGIGAVVFERIDIRFTAQTWFALAWAVVVLSIAAVLIMLWLLQRQAAAKVSSLFFLTPALSALEGALLFGERLGPLAVVGLVVGLMGVALVTRPGPRSAR